MPGLHSAEKLAARHERAVKKGYLSCHSKPGRKFIEVDATIASQVKDMARSLERHRRRDTANGIASHFARAASSLAWDNGLISTQEMRKDFQLNRKANRAKHGPGRGGRLASSESPVCGYRQCAVDKSSSSVQHYSGSASSSSSVDHGVQYFQLDYDDVVSSDAAVQVGLDIGYASEACLESSTQTDMTSGNTAVLLSYDSIMEYIVHAALGELASFVQAQLLDICAMVPPESETFCLRPEGGHMADSMLVASNFTDFTDLDKVAAECARVRELLKRMDDGAFEFNYKQNMERLPHLSGRLSASMSPTDVLINELLHRPCTSTTYMKVIGELRSSFSEMLPDLLTFLNSCVGAKFATFNDLRRSVVSFAQSAKEQFSTHDVLVAHCHGHLHFL